MEKGFVSVHIDAYTDRHYDMTWCLLRQSAFHAVPSLFSRRWILMEKMYFPFSRPQYYGLAFGCVCACATSTTRTVMMMMSYTKENGEHRWRMSMQEAKSNELHGKREQKRQY